MISSSSGVLVSIATLALLVFLVVPSRYLNSGHWGAALLTYAFVEGATTDQCCRGFWFWGALVGGAGLFAHWVFARLSSGSASTQTQRHVEATSKPEE